MNIITFLCSEQLLIGAGCKNKVITILMTTFRLVQRIGQGSYSKVYKAVNDVTQKTLAVKIIGFKDAPLNYIMSRQIKILRECKHPNIAPLLDYIVTEKAVYLVFQYFSMNLSQYYRYYRKIYGKSLNEGQIRHIMMQICSALQYLHSKGIMHRDIKPQNIMVNPLNQELKLIDFGFSKHLQNQTNTGYMVTRWYRPLEIVLGLHYNEKVDVFAAGAIYLELILERQVFQSHTNMDQLYLLLNVCGYPEPYSKQYQALQKLSIINSYRNPYLFSLLHNVNDSTREILSLVLSNSAEKRPSIGKFLQHFLQAPAPVLATRSHRNSIMETRKRSNSAANGLTLVSLAYSSRQRSSVKEERESLTRETNKVDSTKQIKRGLFKIAE